MAMTPEGKVQRYAQDELKKAGFLVRKFMYEGRTAANDLIAVNHITVFIECKKPGAEPEPHQAKEHQRLRNHGALVFTVDTVKAVDAMIRILSFKVEAQKRYNIQQVLR